MVVPTTSPAWRRGRRSRRRILPWPGRSPLPHPAFQLTNGTNRDDRRQDRGTTPAELRTSGDPLAALYAQLLADDQLLDDILPAMGLPAPRQRVDLVPTSDPRFGLPTPAFYNDGARPERPDSETGPVRKTPPQARRRLRSVLILPSRTR